MPQNNELQMSDGRRAVAVVREFAQARGSACGDSHCPGDARQGSWRGEAGQSERAGGRRKIPLRLPARIAWPIS